MEKRGPKDLLVNRLYEIPLGPFSERGKNLVLVDDTISYLPKRNKDVFEDDDISLLQNFMANVLTILYKNVI